MITTSIQFDWYETSIFEKEINSSWLCNYTWAYIVTVPVPVIDTHRHPSSTLDCPVIVYAGWEGDRGPLYLCYRVEGMGRDRVIKDQVKHYTLVEISQSLGLWADKSIIVQSRCLSATELRIVTRCLFSISDRDASHRTPLSLCL